MFDWLLCPADNVKVGPDGSVITIANARPVNHGAYRCVASNPFGITHTIVSLIVKGKLHECQHVHTFILPQRDFSYFSYRRTPLNLLSEGFPLVADQAQNLTSIFLICDLRVSRGHRHSCWTLACQSGRTH